MQVRRPHKHRNISLWHFVSLSVHGHGTHVSSSAATLISARESHCCRSKHPLSFSFFPLSQCPSPLFACFCLYTLPRSFSANLDLCCFPHHPCLFPCPDFPFNMSTSLSCHPCFIISFSFFPDVFFSPPALSIWSRAQSLPWLVSAPVAEGDLRD